MADGSVVVAGALHLDVVVTVPHLPARDETVMGETVRFVCGGKGGNQAVAASRHGARTVMLGRVGDDMFAPILLENLAAAGVDTARIQRGQDAKSGMSVAIVDADGEYGAVVVSGANRQLSADGFDYPGSDGVLVLQNEIPEALNLAVADKAKAAGATVVLNAAPMRPMGDDLMRLVDLLIVNRVEAADLLHAETGTPQEALAATDGAAELAAAIIVTLGGEGLVYREPGRPTRHVDGMQVPVVSTHGAGDAFVGALAARLAAGAEIGDAIAYAQAAAALLVATAPEERDALGPAQVRGLLDARNPGR